MVALLVPPSQSARKANADRLKHATVPLCKLLRELADVIGNLSDAQYTQKPVGVVQSSIGAHIRHSLDHVRSLIGAVEARQLDYDTRRRGTAVESSRCTAISEISELISQLQDLPSDAMDRELSLSAMMTSDGAPVRVRTTLGRELAFTLSHAIHHNALIGAMVITLGGRLPERFGYAPATLKHLEGESCVR